MGKETDTSYYDKVSNNLKQTVGADAEGLSNSAQEISNVAGNDNLSTGTKAAAITLNAAEAGVQAFGAITGAIDNAIEGAVLPALGALGMAGIATLPISKQMDPVMGIDIHFVTIPPSPAPIPMPHPYIGMLFRAKDFVAAAIASVIPPPPAPPEVANPDAPTNDEQKALNVNKAANVGHMVATMAVGMLGATVKVGGIQPRAVAGTPTKSIPHIPMGAGFYPATAATIQKNQGHAFLGSLFTLADEDPLCGGTAHLHLNCNDVGTPSPHDVRPSKNTAKDYNPLINLYLPTGVVNPIPPSRTILTNPVPTPMNPVTAVKQLFKASLGKFLSKKMHKAVDANKKIKSNKLKNKLHKAICTVTGHPVDVATGNFFTDEEDFYIAGKLPISWERTYYSESDYKGPLGYGWHHQYDIGLHIDNEKGILSLRMNDGRPVAFNFPRLDAPEYNRTEQLEAQLTEDGTYRIWNEKESVFYYFTKTAFDEVHLLSSIVDKNGFGLLFKYNNEGHLIELKDSSHRVLTFENDTKGRIVNIFAPHPTKANQTFTIAEYEYDASGNMIRQTNAEGASMYFEYRNHLMVKETWRNGLNWFFKYDGDTTGARCIHTWGDKDIYNHKLEFFNGLTRVENSLGNTTEYYHKGGLVYERIDPNESKHTFQYNEYNELLSETDPEGGSYIYAYDKRGNRTQTVDPDGGTVAVEYSYHHPNLPSEIVDALGGKWQRTYNEQGNLVKTKNPNGAVSKLAWQNGLLDHITDALDNKTHLMYDDAYNLTEIIGTTGTKTLFEYDTLGRNTKITNAKGATQQLEYDLLGRVVKVHDFDGNHIELNYDGIDNLIQYKDKDQTVKYTYSGMWKLTSRSDARGTTHYAYNTEEQLTQILNEKNVPYIFKLNEVGEVVEERSFDQSITKYNRDKAGRVLEKTGNDNKITKYAYTRGGQVSEITYHDGTVNTFDYNPAGQLTTAKNPDAEVTLTRNVLGQITKETINGESISHQYNALGQRTGLQSSLGANMNFEFDALGQLIKHHANGWQSEFEYDQFGFEVNRKLQGGISQQNTYDNIGRLTGQQITGGGKSKKHHRKYQWGVNDRLQSIIDSATGTTEYSYSKTGHLETAKYGNGNTQHRTADKVGNLFETQEKTDRVYNDFNRLEKKGSWRYKYDALGNLIEKYKSKGGFMGSTSNRWKYKWNAQGMLQEVTRPDGEKVSYQYDALGRRLSKKFKNTTTKWLWNGNVPLHEWKENYELTFKDGYEQKVIRKHQETTWVFEENSFVPCGKIKNGKQYAIMTDHLGTPTQAYNDTGEKVWDRELDMNGKIRTIVGDENFCNIRFQGQEFDKDVELCYNRFRWLSNEDGRYISVDPLGLTSGEFGFYNYVDDPNGCIDPFGLETTYGTSKQQKAGEKLKDWSGPVDYSHLPNSKTAGKGKNFTSARKKKIYEENKKQNGGYLVSDLDGTILETPKKSQKGVTPSPFEAQVDHVKPKSKGGSNKNSNAQVLSRKQNRDKSDNY